MPLLQPLLQTIKRQRALKRVPTGENPISTAARFILDRFNNNVPLITGLFASTASVTIVSSAAEATLVGAGQGSLIIPANTFVPGMSILVRATGVYGTKAAAVGNLTIKLKAGSTALATATVAALPASVSGRRFIIEAELVCRTAGVTGSIQAAGDIAYALTASTLQQEVLADTLTSSFDTTAQQTLDLTAQWATSDPANTITSNLVSFQVRPSV